MVSQGNLIIRFIALEKHQPRAYTNIQTPANNRANDPRFRDANQFKQRQTRVADDNDNDMVLLAADRSQNEIKRLCVFTFPFPHLLAPLCGPLSTDCRYLRIDVSIEPLPEQEEPQGALSAQHTAEACGDWPIFFLFL